MNNYYAILKDREVKIVSWEEWGKWFEPSAGNPNHPRYVAKMDFGDFQVSTVFLGINHGWNGRDKWFETMIFGGPLDDFQERYETFDQAVEGFLRAVQKCREVN